MKFEHFAINVEDPVTVAKWYVDHLQMKIVRQSEARLLCTFSQILRIG